MSGRADRRPRVSLVLPVFNEEDSLPELLSRLEALREGLEDRARVDFVLVDDHSTDRTPDILREAAAAREDLRYLRLARNSGSHVAILAGLRHCEGDCAAYLASDLQDPPELIPQMLDLWEAGTHVVWAVRARREGLGLLDRMLAGLTWRLLVRWGGVDCPPTGSDFALLDRSVVDGLLRSVRSDASLGGEIARLGFHQGQVEYVKAKRQHGSSKWKLEQKLKAFADAFVAFSYKPLRLMSYLGMVASALGLLYASVVVTARFSASTPIHGWASLMVVVLVMGGIQMTMLGVLGEYIWRTLEAARGRPLFLLEEDVGDAGPPGEGGRGVQVAAESASTTPEGEGALDGRASGSAGESRLEVERSK